MSEAKQLALARRASGNERFRRDAHGEAMAAKV
jgi:hypothetical protein